MTATPRILVGTLECGEAEFADCRSALAAQCGVRLSHFVVSGRAELAAHRALFEYWNEARGAFDLFVKVDADTVLRGEDALSRLWGLFRNDAEVTGAQVELHDYFSDGAIAGLNCFAPCVRFSLPGDELYCDRVREEGHRRLLRVGDTVALSPIGDHCLSPHPRQAFHYGYRRMLKGQSGYLRALLSAWRRLGGEGRLWALVGARSAFLRPLTRTSYEDPEFRRLFEEVQREMAGGGLPGRRIAADVRSVLERRYGIRTRRLLGGLRRRIGE